MFSFFKSVPFKNSRPPIIRRCRFSSKPRVTRLDLPVRTERGVYSVLLFRFDALLAPRTRYLWWLSPGISPELFKKTAVATYARRSDVTASAETPLLSLNFRRRRNFSKSPRTEFHVFIRERLTRRTWSYHSTDVENFKP